MTLQFWSGKATEMRDQPRIIAAGYQITVREIDFGAVHDKDTLMLAFLKHLRATSFDPAHAASVGLRVSLVHLGLMATVAANTVVAFEASTRETAATTS